MYSARIMDMLKIYGSIIWLIATLFVVYSFSLNTAAAVFSIAIKASLHANDINVSIAAGAFILGFACMQIPAGYLLDKFNARFVVSSGVFLLALGNICISFSNTLLIFTLSNFIEGLGASFAFIAAAILISQWFKPKTFPILFGLTQTLSCILAGITHYYFSIELAQHSWNVIYRWLAIFGFILFVLSLLFIKSPAKPHNEKNISLKNSFMSVICNKQIILSCLAAATSFGVLLAYASYWYLPIQIYYAVNNIDAVIISGIIFAGIGIGTPLMGWLSNHVKSRTAVIHITLITGTMALLIGIYAPHLPIKSLIPIQIISFLIGFLLSGSMLFYTMVSEIASDKNRGVAIGALNTAVFLSNTLMLFIPYVFITETSKEFFTYLWILPLLILTSILLLYFIKDTYEQ